MTKPFRKICNKNFNCLSKLAISAIEFKREFYHRKRIHHFCRFDNKLCTPFKHDIRCASLCGVEFVVTKERREKRAQRESCLKEVQRLHVPSLNVPSLNVPRVRKVRPTLHVPSSQSDYPVFRIKND